VATILIIEDDPAIRELYAAALKHQGYTVAEARDAKEGLEQLTELQPQLIILDLLLPHGDGISFLKAADIPHQYPNTKVLVSSNVQTPQFDQELKQLQVEHSIVKTDYTPYMLTDLVGKLLA
jgi:two-component system chemotaxis response regulator CheY